MVDLIWFSFNFTIAHRVLFLKIKVETIGDCYLAVTGLPNAQENHALIMAKFANECMVKMNETIRALADSLGEDTAEDLSLRVGLHSGPVTAGVLRGQKVCFLHLFWSRCDPRRLSFLNSLTSCFF